MGKREEAALQVMETCAGFGFSPSKIGRSEAFQIVDAVIACIREPDEKMREDAAQALYNQQVASMVVKPQFRDLHEDDKDKYRAAVGLIGGALFDAME